MSESHRRQMQLFAQHSSAYIDKFSKEFQSNFVKLLSTRFNTRRVLANTVYQEYISDRNHLHMNATKWNSLTEFILHLGREGIVTVEEGEHGWYIQWIDNSPRALARQAAIQKKERSTMNDEQREKKLIEEQIARAKQQAKEEEKEKDEKEAILERDSEKIKLNLVVSKPESDTTKQILGFKKTLVPSMAKPVKKNAFKEKEKELKRKAEATNGESKRVKVSE
jgi:DNA/RNA-binding protein KIN17